MSDVIDTNGVEVGSVVPVLPEPRLAGVDMRVRPGRLTDYAFMDALQKANSHGVGFFREAALKGHLEKGNVLVAELMPGVCPSGPVDKWPSEGQQDKMGTPHLATGPLDHSATPPAKRLGYVMGVDRYMKRDELGIIYQMCVLPAYRRSLVAANLLKAKFERSAYGCRLYCCWCAQDLSANNFWESMGFVPLAFRTGSRKTGWKDEDGVRHTEPRMHIFWQKRIREGDTGDLSAGGTSYWFPSQTGGGAMAEDRLVLPIPPGTHWGDAKPVVLPAGPVSEARAEEVKLLETEVQRLEREKRQVDRGARRMAKQEKAASPPKQAIESGGLHFAAPLETGKDSAADAAAKAEVDVELKAAKKAVKRAAQKFDPKQEAFARELKDRWLEQVLAQPGLLAPGREKYAVRRQIEATKPMERVLEPARVGEARRLDAA